MKTNLVATFCLVLVLAGAVSISADETFRPAVPVSSLGPAPFRIAGMRPDSENSGRALAASGFTVEPSSRENSRQFFQTVFQASEGVVMGWTGDYATGNPGTTSSDFREAVRRRINYFRAMAGVPAGIVFSAALNQKCQQAALMMSVNRQLSHTPPPSWKFFTADGAEAAGNSNLAIGSTGPTAIFRLMQDNGENNTALGHRRWFLFPPTSIMGTGDVPREGTQNSPANATWVFDDAAFGRSAPTRDGFVAWPPPGFVPYQVTFARWSFSLNGADFSQAGVTMTRSGTNMPVRLEPVQDGFGDPAIAWVADNQSTIDFQGISWPKPTVETPIRVTVSGVLVGGVARNFDYDVTVFDPTLPGAGSALVRVEGPGSAPEGQPAQFSFNTVPSASSYEVRRSLLVEPAVEGAEARFANVIARTSAGYSPFSSLRHGGSLSFHLATPDFEDQFLTLRPEYFLETGAKLTFFSQLGFASTTQFAEVQASVDSGLNWTLIYSQPGNSTAANVVQGERSFVQRVVDLSAFTGRVVQFRFVFRYDSGIAFTTTDNSTGWLIDDISVSQAFMLSDSTLDPAANGRIVTVFPVQSRTGLLQVRPYFFGNFPSEWGPAIKVSVSQQVFPRMTAIQRTSDGLIRIAVQGAPSTGQLALERSDTLQVWSEVSRQNSNSSEVIFTDAPPAASTKEFYRIRVP